MHDIDQVVSACCAYVGIFLDTLSVHTLLAGMFWAPGDQQLPTTDR
jgi:hypothetical protein